MRYDKRLNVKTTQFTPNSSLRSMNQVLARVGWNVTVVESSEITRKTSATKYPLYYTIFA